MEPTSEAIEAAVLRHLPDPVVVVGPDVHLIWANPRAEERFGWTTAEMTGRSLADLVHPDDIETALLSLVSVADKAVGSLIEIRVRDSRGTYSWFEVRGSGWDDGPVPGAAILAVRESTERRRWELSAGNSEMLGVILDAAPTVNVVVERDGTVRGASRALTRLLKRPLEGTLGCDFRSLVAEPDREAVGQVLDEATGTSGTRGIEARLLRQDGTAVPMSLTVVDLLSDEAVQGLLVAASDISALDEARSELHHLANHDPLTGLPNRMHLRYRLDRILADETGDGHTLLFGDVDGLKAVNDHHGHRAGDVVLSEVATRVAGVTRPDDFVARLSGDEFVVVIATSDPQVVEDVQARISAAMEPPIVLPTGRKVTVSISLGAAGIGAGMEVEDLLAAADAAMYVAKRERRREP